MRKSIEAYNNKKKLVEGKPTVSPTQLTLYHFSTNKDFTDVGGKLADGQAQIVGKLTMQLCKWQPQSRGEHGIVHAYVCRLS